MLKLGLLASLFYIAQFTILGAYTGAAMNLIGGARTYIFIKVKPDKKHHWVLLVFIAISFAATFFTWHGYVSLLALSGSICGGFASWHRKPKYIRRWSLAAPPLWFSYDALSGAIPGMVLEVIMLLSNLLGEYRYDFKHMSHKRRRLARTA
jgi:hypothetical protein